MEELSGTDKRTGRSNKYAGVPLIHPLTAKNPMSNSEIKLINSKKARPPQIDNPVKIDRHLVAFHDPSGVEAELFKMLRTNILFPKLGHPPKTIMVTSALPGDGKSFVASNLSISITHGIEEHVLLMDCDMRRSSIHNRFGFSEPIAGLRDYLEKKKPLASLLKKTSIDKLTLLPSGTPPPNPAELLSSQAMKELMQEVKNRYEDRYIIIDSPPPQLTAETAVLAKYVDGIILVVKYASTPKDLVKAVFEKLGREKVLGVVMNNYRVPTTDRYGYGKAYSYGKYKKY